jgi:hypothetical protein
MQQHLNVPVILFLSFYEDEKWPFSFSPLILINLMMPHNDAG